MRDSLIKNVLVVDDEREYLVVLRGMLNGMGLYCSIAGDAFRAAELMANTRFDLILSDINMKGKDGLELMREALGKDPSLIFVIMTGDGYDHSFGEIVNAGAADFIIKPFSAEDLEARIQRIEREQRILADLSEANRALIREGAINAAVVELSRALISSLSMEDVSHTVLKCAMRLTRSSMGYVRLVDDACGRHVCTVCTQEAGAGSIAECIEIAAPEPFGFVGEVFSGRWPVFSNVPEDARGLSKLCPTDTPIRRFMLVPIADAETSLGFVMLANAPYDYTSAALALLQRLVSTYTLGIERRRADEELERTLGRLRRTLEETVHLLGSTLEMRDAQTAGHQRRVATLACAIARKMGVSDSVVDAVRIAGLVHDIGKISIPFEILSKTSGLNEVERTFIESHSAAGYELLKGVEFPWPIAQITLQHHERMDGSGYPQGLSNGDILLEARILAVADVIEAMVSHRPFQVAIGMSQALEEVSKNRGKLYDPEVADACLKLFLEDGFDFGGV